MLDYIQIYPETRQMVQRYAPADRCMLYEAMLDYGTTGALPAWPQDDLKWFVWEALRQKVDDAERAHKKKQAAGSAGGQSRGKQTEAEGSRDKQTEAEGSRPKQTEAEESKAKPESEAEAESESESDADPEDVDTHTEIPQQGDAGARARRLDRYDPEHPDKPCDMAWRFSDRARAAIAQRIIEHVVPQLRSTAPVFTEAGPVGQEVFRALEAAMKAGIPPKQCQEIGEKDQSLWLWEGHLKQIALAWGTAGDAQDAWKAQVDECAEDLDAPCPQPLAAYG